MRRSNPNQPVHQVVVVRQPSGCLRVLGVGLLVALVLGFVLVRALNAGDRQHAPQIGLADATSLLDEAYKSEVRARGGVPPQESWLPSVRKRFYHLPKVAISRGANPNDNELLITLSKTQYACYKVRELAANDNHNLQVHTGHPPC